MLHISCCVYQQISYYQYLYAGVCNEKCQQESARLQVLQHLYVNLIHVAYSIFYILHVAYFMLQISCCEYQRISYYLYLYVGVCDEKCWQESLRLQVLQYLYVNIFHVAYFMLHISCYIFYVAYFILHISSCACQHISYYQYLYVGVLLKNLHVYKYYSICTNIKYFMLHISRCIFHVTHFILCISTYFTLLVSLRRSVKWKMSTRICTFTSITVFVRKHISCCIFHVTYFTLHISCYTFHVVYINRFHITSICT